MDCEDFEILLAHQVDEALTDPQAIALDLHLALCPGCRAFADLVSTTEHRTRRAFAGRRHAADAVVENVVASLRAGEDLTCVPRVGWRRQLRAGAVGFMIASVIFLALHPGTVEQRRPDLLGPQMPAVLAVAHIRDSTGPVSCLPNLTTEWQPVGIVESFACPSGATIRTPSGTLCELETNHGCRIRMNQDTELRFITGEQVELRRGQVWCSSSGAAPFEIVARENSGADAMAAVSLGQQATCVLNCAVNDQTDASSPLSVVSANGSIQVTVAGETTTLGSGSAAFLKSDGVQISQTHGATVGPVGLRWMRPLLVRKGHDDAELDLYVNSQLARLGGMKLSWFTDGDIRSLGEYSVLPLLRYIQSDQSSADTNQRRRAAKLLADLSPVWIVPELIGLLDDEDAVVSESADKAIERLTGVPASDSSVVRFQTWWETHGPYCPVPPSIEMREL